MTCSCARIRLGSEITAERNWNPECIEHGVDSDWYSQQPFRETRERSVRMQMLAREARKSRE